MPSKVVPGLDERFDRIVNRAMKSDKDARYASVLDLRSDLLPLASGEVITPRRRSAAFWIGVVSCCDVTSFLNSAMLVIRRRLSQLAFRPSS